MKQRIPRRLRSVHRTTGARLLLLVLITVCPLLIATLYSAAQQRNHQREHGFVAMQRLVRFTADGVNRSATGTHHFLTALAQATEVRQGDGPGCTGMLARLKAGFPDYTNIGLVDQNGTLWCTAGPLAPPPLIQQNYLNRAAESVAPIIAAHPADAGNTYGLSLGYPLRDDAGNPAGLAYVTLDVDVATNAVQAAAPLPQGAVTIITSDGVVLATYFQGDSVAGTSLQGLPVMDLLQDLQGDGVVEAASADGAPHLYAFAPIFIDAIPSPIGYVVADVPMRAVLSGPTAVLYLDLAVLAGAAILAYITAWVTSAWRSRRRIAALVGQAERLKNGDLSSRSGLDTSNRDEIGQIASAMDSMAVALQDRDARHAAQETSLGTKAKQEALIADLGMEALKGASSQKLMQHALDTLRQLLNADLAHVLRPAPGRGHFRMSAGSGWDANLVRNATVPFGVQSQPGYTFHTGQAVLVQDYEQETRFARHALLKRYEVRSGISCVIHGKAQPHGVLAVSSRQPLNFAAPDLAFVQSVANLLGIVIENENAEAERDRLVSILEATPDFVGIANTAECLSYVNQAGRSLVGFAEDEQLVNVPLADLMPGWAHRILAEEGIPHALRHGTWEGELALSDRHGNEIPVSQRILSHQAENGEVAYLSIIARDARQRRASEEHIRFQAKLLDIAGQAIIVTDAAGRITYWNKTAEVLYGWKAEEVLGKDVLEITPAASDLQLAQSIFPALSEGKSWTGEFLVRRKNGTEFPALVSDTPIMDDQGRFIGVIGMSTDITDRKVLEEQLQRVQKMEAIGRLAGGVSHDFNNLLTVIGGFSELLLDWVQPGEPYRRELELIHDASQRAAALTRQLLTISRGQIAQGQIIDLNTFVQDSAEMFKVALGENVSLSLRLAPHVFPVTADPTQLEQALLNIVINAREAMPSGGTLMVVTDTVDADERFCAAHIGLNLGAYTVLTITDTGAGMDKETLSRIFEPFFTTKAQGSGLGLPMAYGIVRQAGGAIFAYSEPGMGASFKIFLPATEEPIPPDGAATTSSEEPDTNAETVLLVEDREELRALAHQVLTSAGYQVLAAADGTDALKIADTHEGRIHLLLTDVVMPRISGRQLADQLLAKRADVKVLYMSGFTGDVALGQDQTHEGFHFIQKPFSPSTLSRKVRHVLDAR